MACCSMIHLKWEMLSLRNFGNHPIGVAADL